jgi:Fur family transcriptional regulator, ferric uptake regulator
MSAGHGLPRGAQARVEQAWRVLGALGARRTSARALVINALATTDAHLTVAGIHERIAGDHPEVNISTVHRTVAFLVDKGVAHVLPYPGEARYGLAGHPHHHAVCESCGRVVEIPAGRLARVVAAAERSSSFSLANSGLALFGRCPDCRG